MKVVAYNIKPEEKEILVLANGKLHDLTLICNELNYSTVHYAIGKKAIIVSDDDILDKNILRELKSLGVQYLITRSIGTLHIDTEEASLLNIKIANTPYENQTIEGVARQTIRNLNLWENGKCVGRACCCANDCAALKDKSKHLKDGE
ncbi:lactate dehydrogenase [Sphingobacterium spiritivorum]|uniref:lactate dehydrogenase n=1 Tax=Sphingobacterium spiritivorum TaxID=258 RepID=UPI003DA25939